MMTTIDEDRNEGSAEGITATLSQLGPKTPRNLPHHPSEVPRISVMRRKLETSDVVNEALFGLDEECERRRWPFSYVSIAYSLYFYSSVYYLQGADPSIIRVGEKGSSNGMERDDKASKKARSRRKP
jgi:hypothetical protein